MKSKQKTFKLSLFLFSVAAFFISFFLYADLYRIFYQQDEWLVLGLFFHGGLQDYLSQYGLLRNLRGDSRILSLLFQYPFYTLFPFQVWPFATFSLILHPLIGILTYLYIILLGGGIVGAWIGGLFFLLSSNGSQAVSWFATSTLTLPSTFFGIVSVLLMLRYIKKNNSIYLYGAQISVLASYYFKESGFMFVLFLPFLYVFYRRERKVIWHTIRLFSPIFIYFIVIIMMTAIRLLEPTQQVDKFIGSSSGGIITIVKNAFYYPILSFSQLFIPFSLLAKINPLLREMSYATDLIFIFLSSILFIFIIITSYVCRDQRKSLLIGLFFTMLSFVPYAVLDRGASYLSSRYFYMGIIGGSVLIGLYARIIQHKLTMLFKIYRGVLCTIALGLFVLYAYKNIQYIKRDVYKLKLDAYERTTILNHIKQLYPVLPDNPVFYITGDHPGYYYVENQKMPFQQGIGYTLMVWYYPNSSTLHDLIPLGMKNLWGITHQGYVEINGKGFGYYWSKEALRDDLIQKKKFTKKQIIGFFYHSGNRMLEDITMNIQEEMP